MLYRLKEDPSYIVEANRIAELQRNETEDLQDYDLVLENGQEVLLHKENCGDAEPQLGDYFMICHRSHVYLHPAVGFDESYERV